MNPGSRVTLLQMLDKTPVNLAIELAMPILENLMIPFIIVVDCNDEFEIVTSVLTKSASLSERVLVSLIMTT